MSNSNLTLLENSSSDSGDRLAINLTANAEAPHFTAGTSPRALMLLADSLPEQIVFTDSHHRILIANAAWRERGIGAAVAERATSGNYVALLRSILGNADCWEIHRKLSAIIAGRYDEFFYETGLHDDDHGARYRIFARRLSVGMDVIVISHLDVSELYRLRQERDTICLSLIGAEEAERRRIARELHDETAQKLTAMRFDLMALRDTGATSELNQICTSLETTLNSIHRELRTLSYLLHPPELARQDLARAIASFVRGFAARTTIDSQFVDQTDGSKCSHAIERALYRVVQEALTNVRKHANARHVLVRLAQTPGMISLEVEDDGVGISTGLCTGGAFDGIGVGISAMRERMQALSGGLTITRLMRGTRLEASAPNSVAAQATAWG